MTKALVVGILHDGPAARPLEQARERKAHDAARGPAHLRLADEQRAEPGQAVDHGTRFRPRLAAVPSSTGFSDTLWMMSGSISPKQPPQLHRRRRCCGGAKGCRDARRAHAGTKPSASIAPLPLDAAWRHAPRSPRPWRRGPWAAGGQEIPVLGDDIEQARGHGPRLYQRAGARETAAGLFPATANLGLRVALRCENALWLRKSRELLRGICR